MAHSWLIIRDVVSYTVAGSVIAMWWLIYDVVARLWLIIGTVVT